MAFTLGSARTRLSSEEHLWPTKPSAGHADERSRPSGKGKGDEVSAEVKLLAELEKPSGGRPTKTTTNEPPPLSTTRIADLDADLRPAASKNKQPSLRKRAARGLVRFLII